MGRKIPDLGTGAGSSSGLAGALFSGVQQRVLTLLFGRPDESFYMTQIVKALDSGTGAVDRELDRLEQSGLVSVERIGNQKHYKASRASPIFPELYSIVQKTIGLREPLQRFLAPHAKQIDAAFVYGSVAKKTDTSRSDIDLMVIGDDLTYPDIFSEIQKAEGVLGRPINVTIVEPAAWKRKLREKNSFIVKIKSQPKIFIIGSEADLNDEPKPRKS